MTAWAGERRLWLPLAVLAVLLVFLAMLQYRWIGEIGRAEAERRQSQLERSAWRFAGGLDRDLGQAIAAVRLEPGPAGAKRRAALLARLAASARGERSTLVSAVLLASRQDSARASIESCALDGSECHPIEWTRALDPLRQRLEQQADGTGHDSLAFRPGTLVEDPLAVAVPLFELTDAAPVGQSWWGRFQVNGFAVVQLDAGYLRERVLPQLAETHFGPLSASEFVVAVVRRADGSVLYSSDSGARPDELKRGDLRIGVPFAGRAGGSDERREGGRRFSGRPEGPRDRDDSAHRPSREDETPWLLVVRHRGGSLEHAVAALRWRNLAAGLGVLVLLGAAGVMLATGAQRARDLARQQLDFVAGVTHELNTPLAAIRSAGQNLSDGIVTDAAQVRRYGSLIEQEGRRLTSLVAQVLDFAGIGSAARAYASEPVSVEQVVDDALADLRLALEQNGITVEKDVAPQLPEVRGDAGALRRVVANLLANTAKFAAGGQHVAVRARLDGDGVVVLRVEDRGPGIPPGERRRVFEPFYRGSAAQRNDVPGSGLGLSLVSRVVRAHGGRVRIEDAAGGGTAVVIELPAAEPESEARA